MIKNKQMTKLIVVFTLLCNFALHGQVPDNNLLQKTQHYYWFSVKVSKSSSRVIIKSVGIAIKSGSLEKFIKEYQNGLVTGWISIGPFLEQHEVKQSQLLYRYAGRTSGIPGLKTDSTTYSYYFIKPVSIGGQELILEKTPSRVADGSKSDFMEMMSLGLSFEKLAVGPFVSRELAEKSKFAYGRNVEISLENELDSLKSKKLKLMKRRWESLNWKIVKKSVNEETEKVNYRVSTKFPRKYFAPNAVQVVTINASYSEPHNSSYSFTLQGDEILDNNYVVSSSMSTVYIKVIPYDKPKKINLTGFLIESIIYNDFEIIELEPIYIKIK